MTDAYEVGTRASVLMRGRQPLALDLPDDGSPLVWVDGVVHAVRPVLPVKNELETIEVVVGSWPGARWLFGHDVAIRMVVDAIPWARATVGALVHGATIAIAGRRHISVRRSPAQAEWDATREHMPIEQFITTFMVPEEER